MRLIISHKECASAAPRGAAAGVAFEAGAIANEREVAAFAARLAFVTLGLGFGALLRRHCARARTRVDKLAARDGELLLLELSPAEQLEQQQLALARGELADARASARAMAAEKRAEAKAKGYEGEACGECGNFTLVRNGTCLKCDTCGSTTGCS